MFFCYFGFLLAFLDDETLPIRGLLLWERICSLGSKLFPLRVDNTQEGRQIWKEHNILRWLRWYRIFSVVFCTVLLPCMYLNRLQECLDICLYSDISLKSITILPGLNFIFPFFLSTCMYKQLLGNIEDQVGSPLNLATTSIVVSWLHSWDCLGHSLIWINNVLAGISAQISTDFRLMRSFDKTDFYSDEHMDGRKCSYF